MRPRWKDPRASDEIGDQQETSHEVTDYWNRVSIGVPDRARGSEHSPARTAPPKPRETKVLSRKMGKMIAPMAVPAAAIPSMRLLLRRK